MLTLMVHKITIGFKGLAQWHRQGFLFVPGANNDLVVLNGNYEVKKITTISLYFVY